MDSAYCGPAPALGDIAGAWNLDPVLLIALALGMWATRRSGTAALAGWAVLALAFVSPLCALTTGLFAARSAHHLLLALVAAPLFAAAWRGRIAIGPAAALLLHILAFWAWHVPALYAWALSGTAPYWLMQALLIGTAILFWRALFARELSTPALLLGAIGMIMQMGLLGALITFAPAPLYAPHFATAPIYGLSALADQQLAGLIMWVASLPLGLAAAWPALAPRLAAWSREAAA
jgi:putative membrane protein